MKAVFFLVVFIFALNNTHIATVNIFPGFVDVALDAPLIIWLLLFFILGMVVTLGLFFPMLLRKIKPKKSNVS
tara:strand:+ start:486 stop:704 length:219 start_codon:yes stop_codon:yes gene_type:complete